MRLKFETPEATWISSQRQGEALVSTASPQASSPQALSTQLSTQVMASRQSVAMDCAEIAPEPEGAVRQTSTGQTAAVGISAHPRGEGTAKIIEFRRSSYAPPVRLNELADPVLDRPRILEAPEVVTPPPALGGITIEEAAKAEPERRPGIDMPLQPAPLDRRLLAVAIDGALVLLAGAIFSAIFYQMSHVRPPLPQLIGLGAGMLGAFWAAYQYLLIVCSGTTAGLRAMKLQLQRFDGTGAGRRLRRWRVLGSMLSGISLGMGYAWQFLDEDGLCWHERVTKTYLAPQTDTRHS